VQELRKIQAPNNKLQIIIKFQITNPKSNQSISFQSEIRNPKSEIEGPATRNPDYREITLAVKPSLLNRLISPWASSSVP
jgi:hypothetical protein